MQSNLNGKITYSDKSERLVAPQAGPRKYDILYDVVLEFIFFHLSGFYGLYQCFTAAKWATILLNVLIYLAAIIGLNAGAHRLWCHRAYKARLPLQVLLMLFQSASFEGSIIHWARDHRSHHKYSDTDADPYNAARGVFFSHIGWLVVRKHPEVLQKGKTIDVKDLYDNPVLQFQTKYYRALSMTLTFILPITLPVYFWSESLVTSFNVTSLRLITVLNVTFLVNSMAHKFGNKPYDKNISPTQSFSLSLVTMGECFHNFHHVFPFDYRTGELGNNCINFTTKLIDFFAWIGWAYDLNSASDDMIINRAKRTGDGTDLWGTVKENFKNEGQMEERNIWGSGDADMSEEDKDRVLLLNKKTG